VDLEWDLPQLSSIGKAVLHVVFLPEEQCQFAKVSRYLMLNFFTSHHRKSNPKKLYFIGSKSSPYGRDALTVALRQLSDQYAAQPLIRYSSGTAWLQQAL